MVFNPFDKSPIERLTTDDLRKLIGRVAEGYYVEYKSAFPANEKVAHGVASFANTYGGWYLVGIDSDKATHLASSICGFSLQISSDPIHKLREIVKSHIDPVPVFYPQLIPINSDRAVLAVYIPDGQETPFITKDGRIYRRTYDSSDPIPEASRHAVDRLVDNGQSVWRRFEQFCSDERTFSQSEEDQSWVSLFLAPYPLGAIQKRDLTMSEDIAKLLELSQKQINIRVKKGEEWGTGNYPFNVAQSAQHSVILRQVQPGQEAFNSPTAELFYDGRARFHIPLQNVQVWRSGGIPPLKSAKVTRALSAIFEADKQFHSVLLKFFDIIGTSLVIGCLLSYYQEWIAAEPELDDMQVGAKISGAWRSVPFCDSDDWGDYVNKFGLPVVQTDTVQIPERMSSRHSVGMNENLTLWVYICVLLGLAFGLPADVYTEILFKEAAARHKRSE